MLKSTLRIKTNHLFVQLFRYFFAGGFAFIIDFCALFLLTEYLNLYYLLSAPLAFLLGLIINYLLSIKWVFDKRNINKKSVEFVIFALVGIVGLLLNQVFIWFFTEIINLYYMLSKIISSGIVFLWNFGMKKYLLFR
ncbi:MAG: GtrA family protein [Calditrichia bacterium]|nr:GtrA family protein [Calditrichia bacterium]